MRLTSDEIDALRSDPERLRAVVAALRAHDYTLDDIARLGGLDDPDTLIELPAMSSLICSAAFAETSAPPALLARLFMFGEAVTRDEIDTLPVSLLAQLREHALLHEDAGQVEARIAIHEYRSRYFLSDRYFTRQGDDVVFQDQHDVVFPLGVWSVQLYRRLIEDPSWESFLDVGSGTGCLSILAGPRYRRVAGIDLNPRAVQFARLNAALNDATATFQTADCFEFDEGPFDHVVFAAPSGPTFTSEVATLVTDGGFLGHELLLRFLRERAPDLVAPRGCCQTWAIFAIQEQHGSLRALLEHSLSPRMTFEIEALPEGPSYVGPDDLARNRLGICTYASADKHDAFLALLRQHRIREIVPACLTLRPR